MENRRRNASLSRFDSASYAGLDSFDSQQWYLALRIRQYLADVLDQYYFGPLPSASVMLEVGEALAALKRNPLTLDKRIVSMFDPVLTGSSYVGVRSLTLGKLFEEVSRVPQELANEISAYFLLPPVQKLFVDPALRGRLDEVIRGCSTSESAAAIVLVDLDLPDSELLRHFAGWLTSRRVPAPRPVPAPRFKKPDLRRWVSMGLLPCIDLLLLSTEEKVRIGKRQISSTIHKGEPQKLSSIAKTTLPLARQFLSGGPRGAALMRRLLTDADFEVAERKRTRERLSARKERREDK